MEGADEIQTMKWQVVRTMTVEYGYVMEAVGQRCFEV